MMQTTFAQKILLFVFGLFLTMVLLELGLRLGAAVFNARQDASNRFTSDKSEVRILCLGESTTALGFEDSYPSQLKQVLQTKYPNKKIKVINRGMVSKTSWDILERLPHDLDEYRPQIVVGMIGVNDTTATPSFGLKLGGGGWWRELRIVHLISLLGEHLRHKIKEVRGRERAGIAFRQPADIPSDDVASENNYYRVTNRLSVVEHTLPALMTEYKTATGDNKEALWEKVKTLQMWRLNAYRYLAAYNHARGNDQAALSFLASAIHMDRDEPAICYGMSRVLRALGDYERAAGYIIKAMTAAPREPYYFMEGGRVFDALNDKEQAYRAFRQAMDVADDNVWFYTEAGRWFRDHGYVDEAYAVFKKALTVDGADSALLKDMASVLEMSGQKDEAAKLRQKAAADTILHGYVPATRVNYNEIVRRVQSRGAVMVAMQYPLRDVQPLKDLLQGQARVVFIENKGNFEQVLRTGEASRYFADFFAGGFGHCKAAGNKLISDNLADVLAEKVLPRL
jgi:tetratricopeptide (TPR) repeat protein